VAAAPATAAAPMQAMAVAVPFLPPNRVPLPTPFGQRNVSMMPPPLAMPIMPYGQFPPPRWDGPAPFQGAPSTPTGRGTGRGQGRGRGRAAPSKPAPNPFPEAEQDSELNWGRGGKIRWDVVKSMFTIAQSPALAEQKKHPPHGKLSYWWQKVYEELCLEHPSFLRTSLTVNDAGGKRLQCQRSKLKNRFYDATKIPSGGNEEKRAAAEKMTKMLKDNGVYELLHAEFSDPNIAEEDFQGGESDAEPEVEETQSDGSPGSTGGCNSSGGSTGTTKPDVSGGGSRTHGGKTKVGRGKETGTGSMRPAEQLDRIFGMLDDRKRDREEQEQRAARLERQLTQLTQQQNNLTPLLEKLLQQATREM